MAQGTVPTRRPKGLCQPEGTAHTQQAFSVALRGPGAGAVMLRRLHSAATVVATSSSDHFRLGWELDGPEFEMPNQQNQIPFF